MIEQIALSASGSFDTTASIVSCLAMLLVCSIALLVNWRTKSAYRA